MKFFKLWNTFLRTITITDRVLMTTIILSNGTSEKDSQIREEKEKLTSKIDRFNKDVNIRKSKLILSTILLNKAMFVVDGSFYPSRSTLISAAWFIVKDKVIVV